MKKIDPDDYRVPPGKKVDLDKWPTKGKPVYISKQEYAKLLGEHIEKLSDQQNLLYASNRYALLLIFQAMDAAGKDSAIKHVMSGVNPQGCQVFSFNIRAPKNWNMIFYGRRSGICPSAVRLASSIALTTKKCSLFAFIARL